MTGITVMDYFYCISCHATEKAPTSKNFVMEMAIFFARKQAHIQRITVHIYGIIPRLLRPGYIHLYQSPCSALDKTEKHNYNMECQSAMHHCLRP